VKSAWGVSEAFWDWFGDEMMSMCQHVIILCFFWSVLCNNDTLLVMGFGAIWCTQ